jgi:hypothetical protein
VQRGRVYTWGEVREGPACRVMVSPVERAARRRRRGSDMMRMGREEAEAKVGGFVVMASTGGSSCTRLLPVGAVGTCNSIVARELQRIRTKQTTQPSQRDHATSSSPHLILIPLSDPPRGTPHTSPLTPHPTHSNSVPITPFHYPPPPSIPPTSPSLFSSSMQCHPRKFRRPTCKGTCRLHAARPTWRATSYMVR